MKKLAKKLVRDAKRAGTKVALGDVVRAGGKRYRELIPRVMRRAARKGVELTA